ncbi:MAG: putative cytokinin riboside 5'-monophosphate phosphoribohydrolase [Phycisphaerae bacterium]|nr:MAG: putative cytokinin riboside 5'-monophosphate phosphoribohydrolase [Phycisphaerae bacterium]
MKSVCVFCGSSPGKDPSYVKVASELGCELAARNLRLIYGGGNVGLMGAVADATMAAGGEVVGVIPHMLAEKELAHAEITELIAVNSMHERKMEMANRADAFIALPGGFGTLDELCEILTWTQLGLHANPTALVNHKGFFDGFLSFLDHAAAERFLRPEHRALVLTATTPAEALDTLVANPPQNFDKWLDRESA